MVKEGKLPFGEPWTFQTHILWSLALQHLFALALPHPTTHPCPCHAVFKKRSTRIGVLPRYAESGAEVRWFDTGALAAACSVALTAGRRSCLSHAALPLRFVDP